MHYLICLATSLHKEFSIVNMIKNTVSYHLHVESKTNKQLKKKKQGTSEYN